MLSSQPFRSALCRLVTREACRLVCTIAAAGFFLPLSATAAEPTSRNWLLSAAGGPSSDGSSAYRISATKPWKRRWFEGGRAHLAGYWEASIALFENDVDNVPEDDGTAYLWNVAFAPVLRLQFTLGENGNAAVQPFMDLGAGISFMSDREFRTGKQRSRPLGSFFQFEDRGAVGVKIRNWEVAYQRMHYSNLNLASDNFGIDAHLLLVRRTLRPN